MLGDKVRKYRRQKGLSQERLGELVGFSQSKISKIENGDWDSLSDLRLIAAALEVSIEELVRDEPMMMKIKRLWAIISEVKISDCGNEKRREAYFFRADCLECYVFRMGRRLCQSQNANQIIIPRPLCRNS
jgi:transcriptional regulator with XRE-family HTH domain